MLPDTPAVQSARDVAPGAEVPAESFHPATGVGNLLLARVERMTLGAHIDVDVFLERRARLDDVAATAGRLDGVVLGMNAGFHVCPTQGLFEAGAQCTKRPTDGKVSAMRLGRPQNP